MAEATEEHWLPIVGWEDRYEISDHGRVRSWIVAGSHIKRRSEPAILRQHTVHPYRQNHLMVYFSRQGKPSASYVHRLVLEAFVGPCPPGMECRHLDGDPAHNVVTNLAWGTHTENMADMKRHGTYRHPPTHGSNNGNALLNEEDVRAIRAEPHYRGVVQMLARCFGVNSYTIWSVRTRKTWGHVVQ